MADPTPKLNQVVADPSLKDLLDLLKKDIFLSLSAHHIAAVQSFDPVKQTVSATILYKKTFMKFNPVANIYEPLLVDYPILVDCPVIFLGGGTCSLTFPIAQGDECLILFNDRALDTWFQGGQSKALPSGRLHSFSDGIALVGLRSLAHSLPSVDANRAVLQNGTTMVGVGADKVKVANQTTTLNTLLQSLVTAIKAITTLNSDMTTGAVSSASQTTLTNIATQIGGLLE